MQNANSNAEDFWVWKEGLTRFYMNKKKIDKLKKFRSQSVKYKQSKNKNKMHRSLNCKQINMQHKNWSSIKQKWKMKNLNVKKSKWDLYLFLNFFSTKLKLYQRTKFKK